MRKLMLLLVLVGLVVAGCGDGGGRLAQLAEDTCAELDGSMMLTAGGTLVRAFDDANAMGYSGPEFGDALRAECPSIMSQINDWFAVQERRDNLINEVGLDLDGCWQDRAEGTVTNNASVTVQVFIEVQFLDFADVLIDTGIDSISGLRPGQTATWEANYWSDSRYAECSAEITSVYED